MKLTKYRVGFLSLTALLFFGLLLSLGPAAQAVTHTLDQDDITRISGHYLSTQTAQTDSEQIKSGDTLILDPDDGTITLPSPLVIDLENITIEPSDRYDTVKIDFGSDSDSDWVNSNYLDPGVGDDSGIVILSNGVELNSLVFDPSGLPGATGKSTVNVVKSGVLGSDGSLRDLRFENIQILRNGTDTLNGFKFTGSVQDDLIKQGSVRYDGIDFVDVRIGEADPGKGITGNGILFSDPKNDAANDSVDVKDVTMDELYVGYSGGSGILFENSGDVRDVGIKDSDRPAHSVSELELAIEGNSGSGIKFDGENVEEVSGFNLNYTRIEDNGEAGIYFKGNADLDSETDSNPIDTLNFELSNTLLKSNKYGIFAGEISNSDDKFSPAMLDEAILGENLQVYGNTEGGAVFLLKTVEASSEAPGLTVKDSSFEGKSEETENSQRFGLFVDTLKGVVSYERNLEFMDAVVIRDSDFNYHQNDGILIAAGEDPDRPWGDKVRGVTVESSNAKYNGQGDDEGNGLTVAGNRVVDVSILNDKRTGGEFSENYGHGIEVYGDEGVNGLLVEDTDGDDNRDLQLNKNTDTGLAVVSNKYVRGVLVDGVDLVENNTDGAAITTGESGTIGTGDKEEGVEFYDVHASNNGDNGILIQSDADFRNHGDTVLVGDSRLKENEGDGLFLSADGVVKNPVIENSEFVDNRGDTAGINVSSKDSIEGAVVDHNKISANIQGLKFYADEDLKNTLIVDNTTNYTENGATDRGNDDYNFLLEAGKGNINSLLFEENIVTGRETETGLKVKASENSSGIKIANNIFESGTISACDGSGTAIVLDAGNGEVFGNEFSGSATSIFVKKSSNTITENNFRPCCVTIDASASVEAPSNFWAKKNLDAGEPKFNGKENINYSISDTPFDTGLLEISSFKPVVAISSEIKLDYKVKNVSGSGDFGVEVKNVPVRLRVEGPNGEAVRDITSDTGDSPIKSVTVGPGETSDVRSYSFDPLKNGDYKVWLYLDGGAVSSKTDIKDVGGAAPDVESLSVPADGDKGVGDTVNISYTVKNNSDTTASAYEVQLTVKDPDGGSLVNITEDPKDLKPGDTHSNTINFTPHMSGEYEAVVSVDDGAKTESKTFVIGDGPGPTPPTDEYTPNWDKTGIVPAPVDGDSTPNLEITDKDGNTRTDADVDSATIRVFDISGERLLKLNSVKDLNAINDLENGIYLYTVDMTTSAGEECTSPVMKFVVKQ